MTDVTRSKVGWVVTCDCGAELVPRAELANEIDEILQGVSLNRGAVQLPELYGLVRVSSLLRVCEQCLQRNLSELIAKLETYVS